MKIKEKISSNSFFPTIPWGLLNPFFIYRRLILESVKENIPHISGRIIDYGCGSKPYMSLFKYDEYIGVDIENPGHPHVQEHVDVLFDGNSLPFPEETFDACFTSEVFEHVFQIDPTLKEIKRVLKSNGRILITTPFVWDEHEAPYDYCRYTSFGIRDALERNGFKIISQNKKGSFLQLIIQLKLIYLNRKFGQHKIFKYPFLLIACPALNIISLISSLSSECEEKTIYLGNTVLAESRSENNENKNK